MNKRNKMMPTDFASVNTLSFGILCQDHDMVMSSLFSSHKTTSHWSLDLVVFGSSGSMSSCFWHQRVAMMPSIPEEII